MVLGPCLLPSLPFLPVRQTRPTPTVPHHTSEPQDMTGGEPKGGGIRDLPYRTQDQ